MGHLLGHLGQVSDLDPVPDVQIRIRPKQSGSAAMPPLSPYSYPNPLIYQPISTVNKRNFSQWRRKVFIVGVKEAQNKYHTYIIALTPQITSKDNGSRRKAESQLITCCKDDFFRANDFKQIRESFCECTLEKSAPKQAPFVSSAKQRTYILSCENPNYSTY
jgi:hypothetical protein